MALDQVPKRNLRQHLCRHQVAAQQAGDGLSIFLRDRREESQRAGILRVPLPPQAHDGVAVAQQPRVSGVVRDRSQSPPSTRARMRELPRLGTSSSREPLPLCASFGTDSNEVRGELDFAILQVHRIAQIDDAQVVRIGHREREIDTPGDALIGSRIAKCLAVQDVGAGSNLHPKHPRAKREHSEE